MKDRVISFSSPWLNRLSKQNNDSFNRVIKYPRYDIFVLILGLLVLTACAEYLPTSYPPPLESEVTLTATTGPPEIPNYEITFRVEIPGDTPSDQPVFLNVLDEVTGLAINTQSFIMEPEDEGRLRPG